MAEALAKRLGITYINNDALIWRPDWVPTPKDIRAAEMEAATRAPAWTFDGNFGSPEDESAMERCDTIVWLDLPRWQVWSQVMLRTLMGLITKRPPWQNGNVERWSIFFSRENIIWWSIKTFTRRRKQYEALFAGPACKGKALIRLKRRREVDVWLRAIEAQPIPHGELA